MQAVATNPNLQAAMMPPGQDSSAMVSAALTSVARNPSVFRLPFMFVAIAIAFVVFFISVLMMYFMDNKVPGVLLFLFSLLIAGAGIAFYVVPLYLNKGKEGSISGLLTDAAAAISTKK